MNRVEISSMQSVFCYCQNILKKYCSCMLIIFKATVMNKITRIRRYFSQWHVYNALNLYIL